MLCSHDDLCYIICTVLRGRYCVIQHSCCNTNKTIITDTDHQRQYVDDIGGASRHAFRVYRPASLDAVAGMCPGSDRSPDGALQYGILATLQRRAMRWYSCDDDNDRRRTPTLYDLHTAGRCIDDIMSTPLSPTDHLRANCQ